MGGLPGKLPAGERVLWQGAPDRRALSRRAFHLRAIAGYFAVLIAYSAAHGAVLGWTATEVAIGSAKFAGLAAIPLLLIAVYAWRTAKSTVYTVTNRRVAIRMGVALPMTLNLPFAKIDGAAFHQAADGTGDIVLQVARRERVNYVVLWPHARPWRLLRAQPMLRALPHAERVAQILSRALAASADLPAPLQSAAAESSIAAPRPHAAAAA